MTVSAARKGTYYKARTKTFYERAGYQVAHLERMLIVRTPKGPVYVKRDQFGADLLLMNAERVVFVQVKLGRNNIAAARHEFSRFIFPPTVEQWIVVWEPRAKMPEVIYVA